MNKIAKTERETQNRIILLFQKELSYRYLGNWKDRENNSNVEPDILREWLLKRYNQTLRR